MTDGDYHDEIQRLKADVDTLQQRLLDLNASLSSAAASRLAREEEHQTERARLLGEIVRVAVRARNEGLEMAAKRADAATVESQGWTARSPHRITTWLAGLIRAIKEPEHP